ncbi:MAG TPA: type II toxin-antitoxin system prevent-host-death family antitoxin [Coxiellaceae bacterium]|nr:MAG: prevent-host-death protein [Gammaproteobacteria bacterium RIFCSPHIGHO2_12_FULL_36_30]HLB55818.1 type II toxin-antitoxin system prevent-host-death family antitoxin [Coxiellaceae bacterium]
MYIEIGAFDAKAKLSELLRHVQQGQCYTITIRGRPIANLVPSDHNEQHNTHNAIENMRAIKKIRGVSKTKIKEWINEGRRS